MGECIFCKIAKNEIKAKIVHQDKDVTAFEDINPRAPIHIVIIPKKHIERISDVTKEDSELIGKLFFVATKIARDKGIEISGYRLIINCNKDAGQEVLHLHLHLMGGRKFTWPPG